MKAMKKKYIKPSLNIILHDDPASLILASPTNWADSKKGGSSWYEDSDEEDENVQNETFSW